MEIRKNENEMREMDNGIRKSYTEERQWVTGADCGAHAGATKIGVRENENWDAGERTWDWKERKSDTEAQHVDYR